jgi:hypothetical protein
MGVGDGCEKRNGEGVRERACEGVRGPLGVRCVAGAAIKQRAGSRR